MKIKKRTSKLPDIWTIFGMIFASFLEICYYRTKIEVLFSYKDILFTPSTLDMMSLWIKKYRTGVFCEHHSSCEQNSIKQYIFQ